MNQKGGFSLNKKITCSIIAFLVFVLLCTICVIYINSKDVTAVYTRYNLSWDNVTVLQDGSVDLDLKKGKANVRFKNDVKGRIVYNLYLYTENENSDNVELLANNFKKINENEYPSSLKSNNVKCAYRGYVEGGSKADFKIKSDGDTDLKLLIIIEDNNSYPKEKQNAPTLANIKFSAEVLLDGQYARGSDYTFSLKNQSDTVIERVHNDDGYISFSNIALTEKGTYIYYLSQNEEKDSETDYDKSIYKISVSVEGKNNVKVSYEKDGKLIKTLPRFSNYKEAKNITDAENKAEYPTNEKKSNEKPNYLLWSTIAIAAFLILFYIVMGKKKG